MRPCYRLFIISFHQDACQHNCSWRASIRCVHMYRLFFYLPPAQQASSLSLLPSYTTDRRQSMTLGHMCVFTVLCLETTSSSLGGLFTPLMDVFFQTCTLSVGCHGSALQDLVLFYFLASSDAESAPGALATEREERRVTRGCGWRHLVLRIERVYVYLHGQG